MPNNFTLHSLVLAVFVAGTLGCFEAHAQERYIEYVPSGDAAAFVQAVTEAVARNAPTTIVINGNYELYFVDQFPVLKKDILIRGGMKSATLTGSPSRCENLFEIGESGTLTLRNLEISKAGSRIGGCRRLLDNYGQVFLEEVQISNNLGSVICLRFGCRGDVDVVHNREGAVFEAERVSFVDSGTILGRTYSPLPSDGSLLINEGTATLSNFQIYFTQGVFEPVFNNSGSLTLTNGSLFTKNWSEATSLFFDSPTPGITKMANTTVSGFLGEWCDHVTSLGHNLVDDHSCSFESTGDLVGVAADLAWLPVDASWNPRGPEILRYALVPRSESRAVDSGGGEYCKLGSLLDSNRKALDGDGDGRSGCDRGAVERIPSTLDQGGLNGLYYNAESDGHYLYISTTTYNTMVMWTTFDASGKQAWIFGIGDDISANGHLVADAYINVNGSVDPDGSFTPAESRHWGRLEIDMSSCNQGRLQFQSDVPGFGSGESQFERLASVDQLECVMTR